MGGGGGGEGGLSRNLFRLFIIILTRASFLAFVSCNLIQEIEIPRVPKLNLTKSGYWNDIQDWQTEVDRWLGVFSQDLAFVKNLEASTAWDTSVKVNRENQERLKEVQEFKEKWRGEWCDEANANLVHKERSQLLSESSLRQIWFMCRGPRYTPAMAREVEYLQQELYHLYHTSVVCLSFAREEDGLDSLNGGLEEEEDPSCEHGEPELARRMETERDPARLLEIWQGWRRVVASPEKGGRDLYLRMIRIMNEAANFNGYRDISETWKEQLDIPEIDKNAKKLYEDILPLYQMLHGYVRFKLQKFYGEEMVPLDQPIAAHLLGNMWGQTWSTLMDILGEGESEQKTLTSRLQDMGVSVQDIIESADNFYVSLGMDPMTDIFWRKSQFVKPEQDDPESPAPSSCHPSSLDMYAKDDFRMELCGDASEETFLTAHHEMGHIQYYMNYARQPAIFRDGANPAFHEAIGDCINYGVQSPRHLHRLGLLDEDDVDSESSLQMVLLLRQALYRVPLIVWSLVVDRWRWDVFSGRVPERDLNAHWWRLRQQIQGVQSPRTGRNLDEEPLLLDPLAKFHVPDNTPYMPYFFSGFLQVQLFEGLCRAEYGENVDLHNCDLFGAKKAGAKLRQMLQLGQSRPWPEALEIVTGGKRNISSQPLLTFYKPLKEWLQRKISQENIPIGW